MRSAQRPPSCERRAPPASRPWSSTRSTPKSTGECSRRPSSCSAAWTSRSSRWVCSARAAGCREDIPAAVDVLRVNTLGAGSLLMETARLMRAQGRGTIVVLSSVAAELPRGSNAVYCASKAGLDALARGARRRPSPAGRAGDGRASRLRAHAHDRGPARAAARDERCRGRPPDEPRSAAAVADGLGSLGDALGGGGAADAAALDPAEASRVSRPAPLDTAEMPLAELDTSVAVRRRRLDSQRVRRRRLLLADLGDRRGTRAPLPSAHAGAGDRGARGARRAGRVWRARRGGHPHSEGDARAAQHAHEPRRQP